VLLSACCYRRAVIGVLLSACCYRRAVIGVLLSACSDRMHETHTCATSLAKGKPVFKACKQHRVLYQVVGRAEGRAEVTKFMRAPYCTSSFA